MKTMDDEKVGLTCKPRKKRKRSAPAAPKARGKSRRKTKKIVVVPDESDEDGVDDDRHSDIEDRVYSDEEHVGGEFGPALTEAQLREFLAGQSRSAQATARASRAARR